MVNTLRTSALNMIRLMVCCGFVLTTLSAGAAELTARLDRTNIVQGETVTLIIQTDDPEQNLETDLGVLEADFEILDRRSETQMSIVNGRQTTVVRLLLTLESRRAGQLRVPPLRFPDAVTEALSLTVQSAPELAPGEMPPVFIEVAVDPPDEPYYVHAQLSLTVKIFYQQNLTEASINPPAPDQASVRLLDEVPYPAERNGTRYRVLQRSYAVFPERSGTLVIPPLRLTGRLIERSGTRLWQPSVRGRRITEESEPLSIEVLPRPSAFQGDIWLPARQLTLSQQLSETEGLRVGEPITRTVIIDAVGLEENMLEEPVWPEMPEARIYPDQPQGISRDDGQWVRGHKEFRYAVVPEQAGTLVLPELRLDWWDTVTNQPRSAILPELRAEVAPLQLVPESGLVGPAEMASRPGSFDQSPDNFRSQDRFWKAVSGILAMLWLTTMWLYLRSHAGNAAGRESGKTEPTGETELLKALRQACLQGDAAQTRLWLRRWLKRYGPAAAHGSIVELGLLAGDRDLRAQLSQFEAHGYRDGKAAPWDGGTLWKAFTKWRQRDQSGEAGSTEEMPDLYSGAR